jgi:ATP-dependent DNA ligase
MNIIHSTPVLADLTSTGKKKYWQGFVAEQDGRAFTYSEFWQEGSARQQSVPTEAQGKNVGRKNETTAQAQAIADIESDCKRKQKKGYVPEGEERTRVLALPMLAHSYAKRAHDLVWPCLAQPKLDGVRAVTDGTRFWSREGNLFPAATTAHLLGDTEGMMLDGEIMLDPELYTFEQSISALKDETPDATKLALSQQLIYHVFDVVEQGQTFATRYARLLNLFEKGTVAGWRLVQASELRDASEVQAYLDRCLEQGHEGIMLRNVAGEYKLKHRSKDLLKHKPFVDDEFVIVGVEEGQGKDAGTPVFVCVTEASKEFRARPKGTLEWRQQLWRERSVLIGKKLSVTYQNLTAEGVPRFPVAKAIRDYE